MNGTAAPQADGFKRLIDIGIALSAERDHNRLMEMILLEAKSLCHADGGTLYLRTPEDTLKFEIMRTDSLNIAMGGTTGKEITFPPLKMFDPETGEANHKNIATHVALSGQSVNVPDAYEAVDFDFSGTKKFDEGTGYRSMSFLTIPLKNHQDEVIGVLQLLNAQDPATGTVVPFSAEVQPMVEALTSQAAVALDNQMLMEAQKKLFRTFINVLASAIDTKSPYTGGHCARVPELTLMLARQACDAKDGPFADFDMTADDWETLEIAGGLHDCGKVTTPEYVVDKATKLETIYDRIHEVRMRFEIVKREAEIDCLNAIMAGGDETSLRAGLTEKLAKLDDDFAFVANANIGGEFMKDEDIERIREIAGITWTRTLSDRLGVSHEEGKRKNRTPEAPLPTVEPLLADRPDHIIERPPMPEMEAARDFGFKMEAPEHLYNLGEVYNLSVQRGTLSAEERYKINEHITQTIIMLEHLPFPKHMAAVPEYAGAHHETMIGTGYPRKLKREDMSVPARIMAIADIFEALTAADRPYKKAKTLSESIKILSFMKKDQHIDPDLFELFLTSGIYKVYAEKYLLPEQIDDVDISQYLTS